MSERACVYKSDCHWKDKVLEIAEWYEQNKEEAIPYQRRPTKWDRLGWILQSSASTMIKEEKQENDSQI